MADLITPEMFEDVMSALDVDLAGVDHVAVGVSGGPDSMALCALLNGWSERRGGPEVHALIVDHGLRADSQAEAKNVAKTLSALPGGRVHVLHWEGKKPDTAIQEAARVARYALIAKYCHGQGISHLFLGHHRDDQAETVLFRLAKGSGLDGLAGMQPCYQYDDRLSILRPLLEFSKNDIVETCNEMGLDFVTDPSNTKDMFARVRLRQSAAILAEEGLTSKRLSVTAKRLSRARKALDIFTDMAYKEAVFINDAKRIVFKYDILVLEPEEIVLRCVLRATEVLRPSADYAPRMEKVEALVYDLIRSKNAPDSFRKRTLGGVIFERNEKAGSLILSQE